MANAASSSSPPGAGPSTSSSPPPPPPAAALPEELVEDILLRVPPDDPASLLRAALVCKPWGRLISGPRFRRRYRELHRAPPMLGMLCNNDEIRGSRFVPTTAFRPRIAFHSRALDSRHGRVLLLGEGRTLVVWDPITGEERKLPCPWLPSQYTLGMTWTAAVPCSSAGSNHLDCRHGPFVVAVVRSALGASGGAAETLICTYSSDAAAWSQPTRGKGPLCLRGFVDPWTRSVLVGIGECALLWDQEGKCSSQVQHAIAPNVMDSTTIFSAP